MEFNNIIYFFRPLNLEKYTQTNQVIEGIPIFGGS